MDLSDPSPSSEALRRASAADAPDSTTAEQLGAPVRENPGARYTSLDELKDVFAEAENNKVAWRQPFDDSEVIDEVERNTLSILYANTRLLVKNYTPAFESDLKKIIYQKITHGQAQIYNETDRIGVVRFRGIALPRVVPMVDINPVIFHGFYQYDQVTDERNVPWWVNFTDRTMFAWFHKAGLGLASEEIRAFEHPSMCSLRELLKDIADTKISRGQPNQGNKKWESVIADSNGALSCVPDLKAHFAHEQFGPITTDAANRPTPILIVGAHRLGAVNTTVPTKDGKKSIYAKNFLNADEHDVKVAAQQLPPEQHSWNNFISIEALDKQSNPELRSGFYTQHQLRTLLRTALTGFAGARAVSRGVADPNYAQGARPPLNPTVTINTGNWGCGEYGNNKSVIALIQCAATAIVGARFNGVNNPTTTRDIPLADLVPLVDKLQYHCLPNEEADVLAGIDLFRRIWKRESIRDDTKYFRIENGELAQVPAPRKETDSRGVVAIYQVNVEKFLVEVTKECKESGWRWSD
ncbi:hypothetical protein BJ742DRAFT_779774 [Cladochytrium replicatum]|nr:hypothetical protein BJ742DRAFT_779774 [Cladochytrium replicatum]